MAMLLAAVPGLGPATGGIPVLLIGSDLQGATGVTFGGTPGTIVAQDPFGFLVTVIAPPHAPGTVPVVLQTASGASNPVNFTYLGGIPLPPVALSIAPPTGPTTGGTPFTIVGTGLTGATVTFNGTPATSVVVNGTGTVLTGVTPAGPAGNVPVVVTTPTGATTVPGGYTYL